MSIILKLHQKLISKGKTLAIAESCSGGHLSARFTSLAGASSYFLGSLVCYNQEWKEKILQVSKKTLQMKGAVSEETVREMLKGIYVFSRANYTVAVTGIAGPSGDTSQTPIGTIWVAYGVEEKVHEVICYHFSGDRMAIINAVCDEVIKTLFLHLQNR